MKKALYFLVVVLISLTMASTGEATVINFDDISALPFSTMPVGYAGLTWGTATLPNTGETGAWYVRNGSYSTPHSGTNYAYNAFGPDNLWFSFSSPVLFSGAWFATFGSASAAQVRVRDDLGHVTAWLNLSSTPQYLAANFSGATTIWVERQGGTSSPSADPEARWYSMDDVTYSQATVPIPGALFLLAPGLAGFTVLRRRFKK